MRWLCVCTLLCAWIYSQPSAGQVLGDVFIYTDNYTFDPFPDLPADFGPEIPDEGIDGLIRVADPEDACQPLKIRHMHDTWVALISRSQQQHPTNCTFDVKVRHAQQAGASAAIVYDDVYEALIIMSKPRDHPDPGIPAVFVSEKAGIIMKKLITPGQTRVHIVAVSASAWMSLVMSAFLGFLALTVVLATFYVMRSWSIWLGRTRGRRTAADLAGQGGQYTAAGQAATPGGLPACAIKALPILIYEGKASGTRRTRSSSSSNLKQASTTADSTAVERSQSVPVGAAPTRLRAPAVAAAIGDVVAADLQAAAGGRQQHEQQLSAGAVFLPDRSQQQQQQRAQVYSCSAPSALPVSHGVGRASSTNISSSSLASTAAQAATAAAGATAAPAVSTALVFPAGQFTVAPTGANASSPPRSGTSTPLSVTDDDYDEGDQQQQSALTVSVPGIVTAGPVGARGGATRKTCVVCLERYQTGDKIRVLPCQHRFHARCLDPWLANRRLCPVCKHDASLPAPHVLPVGWAAAGGGAETAAVAADQAAAARGSAPGVEGEGTGPGVRQPSVVVRLLMGGGGWFRRLRTRQQQQQVAFTGVTAGAVGAGDVEGLGASLPHQQQLRSAASYAEAAAAAADAAENGLLLPASMRAMPHVPVLPAPPGQQAPQQQHWRRQRQRSGRGVRQLFGRQTSGEQADLITPLVPASGNGSSSRSARDRSGPDIVIVPQAARFAVNARGVAGPGFSTAPVPIPQLTPIRSDASSAGSQTSTQR